MKIDFCVIGKKFKSCFHNRHYIKQDVTNFPIVMCTNFHISSQPCILKILLGCDMLAFYILLDLIR